MSDVGKIEWRDLTVENADQVKDFYEKVVGWKAQGLSMGDYEDYAMNDADGNCVAGICYHRGPNVGLPAQWLIYINVENLAQSIAAVVENGGEVLVPARSQGDSQMAVIRDPAGAVAALYQK